MLKATLTLPKLETRTVWAGIYGGHYDVIVFFSKKPKSTIDKYWDYTTKRYRPQKQYFPSDNRELVIGDMLLVDFQELYPDADLSKYLQDNERPMDTEITEVFQIKLTTVFTEYGRMFSIDTSVDW